MKLQFLAALLLSACLLALLLGAEAKQADGLRQIIESRTTLNTFGDKLHEYGLKEYSQVYITTLEGSMDGDRLGTIPGQPEGVNFSQYAGYITVDPNAGRALFYYFVESPKNSSTNPLVLWLNGGPGCSSFGYGAMEELGPFRVNADGQNLFLNPYAWNNVANVIFLESPAGVGFSYSNTTSDYDHTGDKSTAIDAYAFLVNWLERFPQYKSRDFYITGESYAGHYVPQLAMTILTNKQYTNQTVINLKGIAIGNAWIDDTTSTMGIYDYLWTHALNSDETYNGILKYCDFTNRTYSEECNKYKKASTDEAGNIDFFNIYAPLCQDPAKNNGTPGSIYNFDPCTDYYVYNYLNTPEVQTAFNAKPTNWDFCKHYNWTDSPKTILPIIRTLMSSGIRVWIYSGDTDSVVPVTSSRYSINTYKLPIKTPWRAWYTSNEVGGYVEEYEGLTFITVTGSGHLVPSYQPERSLIMFSSFLQGTLPPWQ